jgi:multidrug efflux pump
VSYRNGAAVRLSDVAEVVDSVQDLRTAGSANGRPAVFVILNRQPGANIIETTDRVRELLPLLRASIPGAINLEVMMERTTTIRASLREVELALAIAIGLVIVVVLVFLRNLRATLIPAVAVPVSLIASFGVMYLAGFSINNLSLMALTIATGFVVDDAVVVLENVSRHIEEGMAPMQAALRGAREVGFTVLSMSLSLIAGVHSHPPDGRHRRATVPRVLGHPGGGDPGVAPHLAHHHADDVRAALKPRPDPRKESRRGGVAGSTAMLSGYRASLGWSLRHPRAHPARPRRDHRAQHLPLRQGAEGLLPAAGHRPPDRLHPRRPGHLVPGDARQARRVRRHREERSRGRQRDRLHRRRPEEPRLDVHRAEAARGAGRAGSPGDRPAAHQARSEPGAQLFLNPVQDIRVGGRLSDATYQFTLQADELEDLRRWTPRLEAEVRRLPELADVNTDQEARGLQTTLVLDRESAARLGINTSQIDSALNLAFGQSLVSTIYAELNQYRVVLEAAPRYWQSPTG